MLHIASNQMHIYKQTTNLVLYKHKDQMNLHFLYRYTPFISFIGDIACVEELFRITMKKGIHISERKSHSDIWPNTFGRVDTDTNHTSRNEHN